MIHVNMRTVNKTPTSPLPPAGLPRRIGAMFYDTLLLLAVLYLATALARWLAGDVIEPGHGIAHHLFQFYLLLVFGLFFVWFWIRGGQTLGMRAWHIQVRRANGKRLTLGRAVVRFCAALLSLIPLGLGFWWILIDPQRRAWHDRIAGTVVVRLP